MWLSCYKADKVNVWNRKTCGYSSCSRIAVDICVCGLTFNLNYH